MTPEFTTLQALSDISVPSALADSTNTATSAPTALADSTNTAASVPAVPMLLPNTVTLDTPIQRGSQIVTHVTLRRPLAGELRGIALASLLQLDVGSLQALLPRITSPMLTRAEIDQLDPADLVELGSEAINFFLPKKDRESLAA